MVAIIKKIRFKIRSTVVNFVLRISLILNQPKLGAAALWLAMSEVNPGRSRQNEYIVLCIGRTIFSDDVAAMANFSQHVKYINIHRSYFCLIFNYLAGDWEKDKLSEENYHVNDFCLVGKERYYLYLKKLLPCLHRFLHFDAIFSGNFAYVEHQELMRVCEENKMPFVVLFKEGIAVTASGAYDKWLDMCRGCKFNGARVLFYGDKIRRALLSINMPGLTENKTKVVGAPRLDVYFSEKNGAERGLKKQIVFFSFYSDNFFNLTENSLKLQEAKKRCYNFHTWVMSFAKRHPDYKTIVKTKLPDHYYNYANEIYKEFLKKNGKEKIDNLIITNAGNSAQLIKESSAVVGFYSTTLTEAIVAGKISLSPYFGDIITDKPWDYFAEYPELINYVKSENDLAKYVLNQDKYLAYSQGRREEFLKQLIYIPDGRASFRAEEAIVEIIKEYRNN